MLCRYKNILFFSLFELFLAFIFADITGNLVNSLFGVKIFNPFLSFTSASFLSSGYMGCISAKSEMCGESINLFDGALINSFNFILFSSS